MSHELHEGEEPAPPGVRPAAALRWLLLLGAAALAVWAFYTASRQGKGHLRYTCPMVEHAFVVADEPGDCPLCHMKLMPLDPALIEARRVQAQEEAAAAGPGVPGLTPVSVHLDRAQKMGVRSVTVDEAEIDEGARAPAYVASPEQGESRAHARAPGYVERIVVTEVGTAVAAGQPLAYVYAPEIYKAQEEFLLARRWRDAEGAAAGAAGSPSSGLAEAARRRLSLLGLSDRDVAEIIEKNAPIRATAVRAPAAGVVTRKEVALGSYVTPETPLFEIVDLSRAYLVADLLASEAALLRPGTEGRATFAGQAPVPVRVDRHGRRPSSTSGAGPRARPGRPGVPRGQRLHPHHAGPAALHRGPPPAAPRPLRRGLLRLRTPPRPPRPPRRPRRHRHPALRLRRPG
jgi:Cu(I)/Ag(I) efflux system membrane fusion protein